MCGIFGQITNNPKRINDGNIKILGIANIERGRNSCGITFDGSIKYGLDDKKLFNNFSKGLRFKPEHFPVVFGHTRQSSVGIVNEANAHPFGFGENSKNPELFRMIGAHNGTLYNHDDLAKEYGVSESTTFENTYGFQQTRYKIDSEILLEIIYRTGNFKVLSEYNGGAALVWTDTDEPNVVYLFSGASKEYPSSATAVIERPLFVYVESKNNMYFSSLSEPLEVIGGTLNENVFQIDNNVVYRIKNGNFANAEKIAISRLQCTGKKSYANYGGYQRNTLADNVNSNSSNNSTNHAKPVKDDDKVLINIRNLGPYFSSVFEFENRIYEKGMRYYKSGTLITGIFIFIPGYGLLKMASSVPDFEKRVIAGYLYQIFDKSKGEFTGEYWTDNDTHLKASEIVPFKAFNDLPTQMYFIEGVRVRTALDFTATLGQPRFMNVHGKGYSAHSLSFISVGPVFDIHKEFAKPEEQGVIRDGELFTGSHTDICFGRLYKFEKGNCVHARKFEVQSMVGSLSGLKSYDELIESFRLADERRNKPTVTETLPAVVINDFGCDDLVNSEFNKSQMTLALDILNKNADLTRSRLNRINTSNITRENHLKNISSDAMEAEMKLKNLEDAQKISDLNQFNAELDEEITELVTDAFVDVLQTLSSLNNELLKYDDSKVKHYKEKLISLANIIDKENI